jgi:hypothetical protein
LRPAGDGGAAGVANDVRISQAWTAAVAADADPLLRLAEYLRLASPQGGASAATAFDPGWSFWLEFWSKANRDSEIRAEVYVIYDEFGRACSARRSGMVPVAASFAFPAAWRTRPTG